VKAITTTYRGATERQPACVIATDHDGNRARLSWDGLDGGDFERHFQAVRHLCDRMQWHGRIVGGMIRNGYVWVWLDTWSSREIGYLEQTQRREARRSLKLPEGTPQCLRSTCARPAGHQGEHRTWTGIAFHD
jgi:hypothetical protein